MVNRMKRFSNIVYIILLVVWGTNCQAQTKFNIVTDFGHREMNVFNSITPLEDGYMLVIGTTNALFNDNRCSMVVKTDNEGNKLYSTFIGDSQYDVYEAMVSASSVFKTESGTYKFLFNIGPDIKLMSCEFDESLQIIDTTIISEDTANRYRMLCNTYAGDCMYIGGQDEEFYEYLAKCDVNGNVVAEAERVDHLGIINMIIDENRIIAAGLKNNNYHNWVVQKIDSSLNIIWQKTYGRTNMVNGVQIFIAPSPDSCYIMSGIYPVCYNSHYQRETNNATCIRKIDEGGNLLWERIIKNYYSNYYNGPGMHRVDCTYDLYVDEDGYIYVAGQGTNYTGFAGFLTKLTPDGNIMYRRYYTPDGSKSGPELYLNSVKPTPDGGLIMGGYTYDSYYTATEFGDYFQQPWLVKTDMDGLDGLCYTELPELTLDVFIPDTVCNLDTIDCVVNISGPSAPYRLDFSTGQVIDNIYYPDIFVPEEIGIDTVLSGELLYQYTEPVTEATIKDTAIENIIARHYNIAPPTLPGEQQLAITLTDFYGNTKTIYKDLYVNPCHEVEVDENENVVLSVYPNPATEYINISGENIAGIEICNLLGDVVYEMQQCNGNNVISTDGMGAGSYFVRIRMEDGKMVTKKIVVVE